MELTESATVLGFRIELKNEVLYKVHKQVVHRFFSDDVEISSKVEWVPAARADLELILSTEAAATVDTIATVTSEKEAVEASIAPLQQELDAKTAELEALKPSVDPDPLKNPLNRTQFEGAMKFFNIEYTTLDALIDAALPDDLMTASMAKGKIRTSESIYRHDAFWDLIIAADPDTTSESLDAVWPTLVTANGKDIIPA